MLNILRKKIKFARITEVIVAIIAVVIFISFATYMLLSVKKNSPNNNFAKFYARFNDIDGISVGSDVKISGYKVGSVESLDILPDSYDIKVVLNVAQNIPIPKDTTASVRTSGILGGKYIALIPGGDEEYLKSGDEIIYTQSAINLENLIGSFVKK
jgi:phospholipid/cholesterol/gamma-HCH transport system substrate-binding protein